MVEVDILARVLNLITTYLPGSEPYLAVSLIISIVYFIALVYQGGRRTAPSFVESIKIFTYGALILFCLLLLLTATHLLAIVFFPPQLFDNLIFPTFVILLLMFPLNKIIFKNGFNRKQVFELSYAFSICLLLIIGFFVIGAFFGHIQRLELNLNPTYIGYSNIFAVSLLLLLFASLIYWLFFDNLEKEFLKQKKRHLRHSLFVLVIICCLIVIPPLFNYFVFNSYSLNESKLTYVINGNYFGECCNSGILEKSINITLDKKQALVTPFEACDGWNVTGDVDNSSFRLINSTKNITITCTKVINSINATLTRRYCPNYENYSVCPVSIEIVDIPFRIGTSEWLSLFDTNVSCSAINIFGKGNESTTIDITQSVNSDGYAPIFVDKNYIKFRIDYAQNGNMLWLRQFETSKSIKLDLNVTCYH